MADAPLPPDRLAPAPVDVALRDGSTVRVRRVRREDEGALLAFLEALSPDSRTFRFFSVGANLARAARAAAELDASEGLGLVATAGSDEALVAHALFVVTGPDEAEVAFEVADAWQGHGLGTSLLAHLAEAAASAGIAVFHAIVMAANHRMAEMFRASGFPVRTSSQPGELTFTLPTALDSEARSRFEDRERTAAVAAVRTFLAPESVALVGASRRPDSVGGALLANLRASFRGPLHLVNPRGGELDGLPVHRSLDEVPAPVELAVVAVPAPAVLAVAEAAGRRGVRALLVVSGGFEHGTEGEGRRSALLEVCRRTGMRLVGPNCLGVASPALNATFAPGAPPPGPVALVSDSGGIGIAAMEHGRRRGLGFSGFASVGDRADVSSNDMLEWFEQDPWTEVIALYAETFGNPRRFARIARRVSAGTPIVAVKSGRSSAARRAAGSHTGALVAASEVSVDALFHQAGVIRTDTVRELLDVAALLASAPLPAGPRLAVLTNAGGPGIMCVDAAAARGLVLAPLGPETERRVHALLPPAARVANPLDLLGDATPERYGGALAALVSDPAVDAVIVIHVPTLAADPDAVARAVAAVPATVPVATVWGDDPPAAARGGPAYMFPEEAATALARAAEHAAWRRRSANVAPGLRPPPRTDEAAAMVAEALARGAGWLDAEAAAALAACYGLPLVSARRAASAAAAARAASELGGPVAVKAISPTLLHKSDGGGVRLGLRSAAAARRAATEIARDLAEAGHQLDGLLVQRMAPPGVELLMGITHDPHFGPLIACAAGGVTVELLRDAAVRLAPLDARDPGEMLRSLATFPLLDGYRGARRVDLRALEDLLARVSSLAEHHPEVAELDANPVIATPDGCHVVDLRIRVAPVSPPPPLPSLQASGG